MHLNSPRININSSLNNLGDRLSKVKKFINTKDFLYYEQINSIALIKKTQNFLYVEDLNSIGSELILDNKHIQIHMKNNFLCLSLLNNKIDLTKHDKKSLYYSTVINFICTSPYLIAFIITLNPIFMVIYLKYILLEKSNIFPLGGKNILTYIVLKTFLKKYLSNRDINFYFSRFRNKNFKNYNVISHLMNSIIIYPEYKIFSYKEIELLKKIEISLYKSILFQRNNINIKNTQAILIIDLNNFSLEEKDEAIKLIKKRFELK